FLHNPQSHADILTNPTRVGAGLPYVERREGGAQVAPERLLRAGVPPSFFFAPALPRLEEVRDVHGVPRPDVAALPHEGPDGAVQVFEVLDEADGRFRLQEVSTVPQPLPPGHRPQQDPGQLAQ